MKPLLAVAALILIVIMTFIFFPSFLSSVEDAQTDRQIDNFTTVTVSNDTGAVTLAKSPYKDRLTNIYSLTANNTSAAPYAYAFNSVSRSLTVKGLGNNTPQDIVVTYDYDANPNTPGVGEAIGAAPWLIAGIVLLSLILSIAFAIIRKGS